MKRKFTNVELKPCPFCGGNAYIGLNLGTLYISCKHEKNCIVHCDTWLHGNGMDIYEQIKLWNKRKGEM